MARRLLAGVGLVVAVALAVVVLGLLADAVSVARQPAGPASVPGTVGVEAPGAVPAG